MVGWLYPGRNALETSDIPWQTLPGSIESHPRCSRIAFAGGSRMHHK